MKFLFITPFLEENKHLNLEKGRASSIWPFGAESRHIMEEKLDSKFLEF